jgi:hypothetical protein
MTWWNETGATWGWAGCLLAAVVLLVFWGAVFAAITALFGTNTAHPRYGPHGACPGRATRPTGITTSSVEPAAVVPPRRP